MKSSEENLGNAPKKQAPNYYIWKKYNSHLVVCKVSLETRTEKGLEALVGSKYVLVLIFYNINYVQAIIRVFRVTFVTGKEEFALIV